MDYCAGLKGSIRVLGLPPLQTVHIAQVVQEGMRAVFAARRQAETSDGASERDEPPAEPQAPTIRELHRISTTLSERPTPPGAPARTPIERVKVGLKMPAGHTWICGCSISCNFSQICELHRLSLQIAMYASRFGSWVRGGWLQAEAPVEFIILSMIWAQVSIVPLICVHISGLRPQHSDELERATLDIHPRELNSNQEPVSLVLEVVPGEPEQQEVYLAIRCWI